MEKIENRRQYKDKETENDEVNRKDENKDVTHNEKEGNTLGN